MYNRCRDKSLVQAVVGKYEGRPRLSLKRTIDGRKQGRRFKAVSANETQRVRSDCFVRMQSVSDKGSGGLTTVLIFSRARCSFANHCVIYIPKIDAVVA